MNRELRSPSRKSAGRRHNFAAALVAGGAIAFLYYDFGRVTAEEASPAPSQMNSVSSFVSERPLQTAALERQPSEPTLIDVNAVPQPHDVKSEVPALSSTVTDRYAVLFSISQLQRGIENLERQPTYSVVLERQERIDGELKDPQQIEMKLRHAPFSVYMKWLNGDKGRQLLFADQQNEGKMLVKLGGFKGNLIGTLKVEPDSPQAKAETRHPVTQAGLVNLARELIHHRQRDLANDTIPRCVIEEGHQFDGRPCYKMIIEYRDQSHSPLYRKAITLIDEKLSLPVYVKNYTWPSENTVDIEETMIECYAYTQIKIEEQLADAIWQKENPTYRFR